MFLHASSWFTRRHAVLLPREARGEHELLRLRAPYRVDGGVLRVDFLENREGEMRAVLRGYQGHFPRTVLWTSPTWTYTGPCSFLFDLGSGEARFSDRCVGRVPLRVGRRFCWDFFLRDRRGIRSWRRTGHYVPAARENGDGSYFEGDTYVDYEQESSASVPEILGLIDRYDVGGPVLEVGCATGNLLRALLDRGLDCVGIDLSAWAVTRCRERLGHERAWVCDVETEVLPAPVLRRAPFGAVVLWSVLEHFARPFEVLSRLTPLVRRGGALLLQTTNSESLSKSLFGSDWEGYFDPTHRGIEQVSARSLRAWLDGSGWRIAEFETTMVWDRSPDAMHATLRDWWHADARFRELLRERELGDFVVCVAFRDGSA